jgi:hypothetical protein
MNRETPTILYIVSSGRSGSTLLELLLGSYDEMVAVGELNVLPYEIEGDGVQKKCGCGEDVLKCNFWKQIISKNRGAFGKKRGIAKFREGKSGWKTIRIRELGAVFGFRLPGPLAEFNEFCDDNKDVFDFVGGVYKSEKGNYPEYIVDSSKDLYRLLWLSSCKKINVRVIKIIKDPRAFVYTMSVKGGPKRWKGVLLSMRMSLRYVVENFLMDRVCGRISVDNFLSVRYEDLAGDPKREMDRIVKWLGINYKDAMTEDFRLEKQHGIAGNETRHKHTKIVLDEEWKKYTGLFRLKMAWWIGGRFAKRYGYKNK